MRESPPILFLLFNRPELANQVFERIREIRPSRLFIAVDGPRANRPDDSVACEKCRQIAQRVDWPCTVMTLYRQENLGCRTAISTAICWFFDHVEEGIILEDDCLPHPSFAIFCAELLEKYRDCPEILSIGGCNLGYASDSKESYGFTSHMNMWGWATWADRAKKIDYTMSLWNAPYTKFRIYQRLLCLRPTQLAIEYRWYKYWEKMFCGVTEERIDTWDYQWIFHQLNHKMLSIFPRQNLICNMGFGPNATHTFDSKNPLAELQAEDLVTPLKHPIIIEIDPGYDTSIVRERWCGVSPSFKRDFAQLRRDVRRNAARLMRKHFLDRMNKI
jgi:hypothetical protein